MISLADVKRGNYENPLDLGVMDCCGLLEASSEEWREWGKQTFKEWTKKCSYTVDTNINGVRSGAILATATTEQGEYKKWLSSVGFKKLHTFWNNNTGNVVTLYIYTLFPEKMKKEKKNG